MGAWGPGLYQDDKAMDLKDSISLLSKMPADGDRLLEILKQNYHGGVQLSDNGGPTFWLVLADQFERKGIASKKVFDMALEAIDSGADLRDMRDRDMDEKDVAKRAKALEELGARLGKPRKLRKVPAKTKAPAFVVDVGEVYAFPTMRGDAFNAWKANWEEAKFTPDAWGAFIVLNQGREYDWFEWCAVGSLSVPRDRPATLDEARAARLIQSPAMRLCLPNAKHLEKMQARLLGKLPVDPAKAAKIYEDYTRQTGEKLPTTKQAIGNGLSISSYPRASKGETGGIPLSEVFLSD
jgi:hypothetical protein